jgi:transaldolase
MQFFLDTANLDEIRRAVDCGLIDGVTTNPSLFARESGDWRERAAAICQAVAGPVSLEAVSLQATDIVQEAMDLIRLGPNVVVKIPVTEQGLRAIRELSARDVQTNATLVFSPMQALLAAKAGAAFVSPFVGRLDAVCQEGMDLVRQILAIFDNYSLPAQVIVASIRHPLHVLHAALAGAHAATVPFSVLFGLIEHPLTASGLERFLKDWDTALAKSKAGKGR